MNYKVESLLTVAASALLIGTLISGCQDTGYPDPQPTSTGPNSSAKVLIANASADANALSAFVENVQTGAALALGQFANYVGVPIGSSQLRVKGAGGTLGTNDLSQKSTFLPNTNYTVFVTDSVARPLTKNATGAVTDAGGIRFLTVTDNLVAPASGNAHVRVLQLAADAGAVSVRLQPSAPASVTTAASFLNRAYRVTTITSGTVTTNYANFTPVPAATYTAQVYTGATLPTSATVSPILSVSGVTLADGKIYTLYARGLRRTRTLALGTVQHN